jgi:plasmid stabilization system protein ParE
MAARHREVIWAESAQAALDEVIAYIAKDSPDGARRVLSQALDAAASLSTLSERGRVVPELNDPSIREVFVFRYRLLYQVRESTVVVLAFLHGARDFHSWRTENTEM